MNGSDFPYASIQGMVDLTVHHESISRIYTTRALSANFNLVRPGDVIAPGCIARDARLRSGTGLQSGGIVSDGLVGALNLVSLLAVERISLEEAAINLERFGEMSRQLPGGNAGCFMLADDFRRWSSNDFEGEPVLMHKRKIVDATIAAIGGGSVSGITRRTGVQLAAFTCFSLRALSRRRGHGSQTSVCTEKLPTDSSGIRRLQLRPVVRGQQLLHGQAKFLEGVWFWKKGVCFCIHKPFRGIFPVPAAKDDLR